MVKLTDRRQARALSEWLTMVDSDSTASIAETNGDTLVCTEVSDGGFGNQPHYVTTHITPEGECFI